MVLILDGISKKNANLQKQKDIFVKNKFQQIENKDIYGAIGGFHLFRSTELEITKTAKSLKKFGLKQLVGGHCTGIHAARTIADIASISKDNLSHGAIGTVVTKDLKIVRSSVE